MGRRLHNKNLIDGSNTVDIARSCIGRAALRRILVLSVAALIGAYTVPARAGDAPQNLQVAFDLPSLLTPGDAVAASNGSIQPVSQTVLATQRGSGSAFAIPAVPAAQSQPGIILWDELKTSAQTQNISTPGGTAVNQINPVQIR
jgi:hypothetical protein